MAKLPKLECCPSCNGTTGYKYNTTVKMEGEWGESAESTGEAIPNRWVKCLDCGYLIQRYRAANEKGSS